MTLDERLQLLTEAAADLDERRGQRDGMRVATTLGDGLNTIRDLLHTRTHIDVEQAFGIDSMLMPTSSHKTINAAKAEIDVYQVAESAAFVAHEDLIPGAADWYPAWLSRIRFGALPEGGIAQRLDYYASKAPDDRRRAFSTVLERVIPEARKAPLIIYRLLPDAIAIVTAHALGDSVRAADARRQQVNLLQSINDCRSCHGGILENGEKCPECGNPIWKFEWLTAE